jgi:hypothetical protein
LDIDIWKDGKKFASAGSIEDLFFSASDRERRELEVIISIDTVSMDNRLNNVVKIGTIHNPGSGLYTFNVPMDVKLTARSPLSNVDRITFGANETVPVFGMQATSNNSLSAADLSEESISKLEWALIFTLNPIEQ